MERSKFGAGKNQFQSYFYRPEKNGKCSEELRFQFFYKMIVFNNIVI